MWKCLSKKFFNSRTVVPDSKLNKFYYLPENNASQVQLALFKSPVSVIMYACNYFDLKNFGMGVYKMHPNYCNPNALKYVHAVTIIGYGETAMGE